MAINYRWQCLACPAGNEPFAKNCESCGCPAKADSMLIEGWRAANESPGLNPNGDGMDIGMGYVGNCRKCGQSMFAYDSMCPHCFYIFTNKERQAALRNYVKARRRSTGVWLIIWVLFFLVMITIKLTVFS